MLPSPDAQSIEVTILLTGGQQYTVDLLPDSPLLRQLFEGVVDQTGDRAAMLFQVPIRNGKAMLCFRGDRLTGLITEPSIVLEQEPQPSQVLQVASPASTGDRLPSQVLQIDHFLTPEEHRQLLEFTLAKASEFVSTSTSTGQEDYRKSVVLHSFPEFTSLITRRIRQAFPNVLSKLNLPPFGITQIEAQLTGHNDGNYYKVHNDNGSYDTASRELTYVYYFYQEPKAFSGGELVVYDSRIENNYYVQADTFHLVEPRNNSIVFFLSRYMHEVLPVTCPSRRFEDSRFTINGWIRR